MEITIKRTVCKHYVVLDEDYVLLETEDGRFVAINYKDIDENGYLKRPLNGIQMFMDEALEGTMELVRVHVEIQWYKREGMTTAQAFAKAWKLEYKEEMEQLF